MYFVSALSNDFLLENIAYSQLISSTFSNKEKSSVIILSNISTLIYLDVSTFMDTININLLLTENCDHSIFYIIISYYK